MAVKMKLKENCAYCSSEIYRYPCKTKTYFCNINCKGKWQTKQRELLGYTKEWLIDQYFNLGKDCNQIAKEIGRDGKRVWEWFRDYGIEVNKRGYSKKQQFAKGHKTGVGRIHTDETKSKIRDARIKDGHVPYLKDGIHWLKHAGAISPMYKGGVTPERQAVYSSELWSESVKVIWKRDNATCQRCGIHQSKIRDAKFHIHHIVSFAEKHLRCEPDNLILLCQKCHRFIHSKGNIKKEFIKTI